MPESPFRFSLGSGQSLPCHLSWRIENGYRRMSNWSEQAETITLGIWGPGDLVIPSLIGLEPIERITLSPVQVVETTATQQHERCFLIDPLGQASTQPVAAQPGAAGGDSVVPDDGDQGPQPRPPVRARWCGRGRMNCC
jgi:hypothetical protein